MVDVIKGFGSLGFPPKVEKVFNFKIIIRILGASVSYGVKSLH